MITGHNESKQNFVFGVQIGEGFSTMSCSSASIEGTTEGQAVDDITVTPAFAGCTYAFGTVQIIMNGCKFTFTGEGTPAGTFNLDIVGCTTGKQIEVKVSLLECTFLVPEQEELAHVVGKNLAGGQVTMEMTLSEIFTVQKGIFCPNDPGHESHAVLGGNMLVNAYKDAGAKEVTVNEHKFSEFLCDQVLSLKVT